jgi:hypothetical protein
MKHVALAQELQWDLNGLLVALRPVIIPDWDDGMVGFCQPTCG